MSDCMTFPNSWREFLHSYSFFDTDKVYTNGSELIQVFRVEQLLEHIEQMTEHRPNVPEPVKARWLYDRESHYKCSHCGFVWGHSIIVMSYCPHCGAEMDERIPTMSDDGKIKLYNTDTGKFEQTD